MASPPSKTKHTGANPLAVPKKLETLFQEIHAAYNIEAKSILERNENGLGLLQTTSKPIRQLYDEAVVTDPHESLKLEVMQGWEQLLEALIEQQVFWDYNHSMEEAFREIAETPWPSAISEDDPANNSYVWFRHQFNLVKLLTHTVQNHYRDNCTECRFVTILEVALSYQSSVTTNEGRSKVVYKWKPSEHVKRFWVRLMQPIDPDMAPFDFRRKAYGVLVSLSWVPSSKGLLEACSIADSRPLQVSSHTPVDAQRLLQKIPRRPLSRNDCVYQVLDRLKDETNVSVVISASKYNKVTSSGIGKSTVASLVASHSLILRSFKVLWLNIDYKRQGILAGGNEKVKLDYVQYVQYLDSLCDQLGCDRNNDTDPKRSVSPTGHKRPIWPEVHSLKRLEEPAIRHRREENMMRRAQQLMADLLEKIGSNILLILDDLSDENELGWFHYFEKQSILATSRSPIHTADFVVELDPWGEEESKELFLLEANVSESHVIVAEELKQIVTRCHYHPVIVRTAARLFLLKRVTSGLITALEEANGKLLAGTEPLPPHSPENSTSIFSTTPRALAAILDTALSPTAKRTQQPSMLFRLCIASMAAVFGDSSQVPLTAVLLLWEQLFIMEPDAIVECGDDLTPAEMRRRVWFIAEGLTHMGLLSFTEDESGDAFVAIHHDMYKEYALGLVEKMDLGSTEGTCLQWHKAFVAAYLTRKFEGNNCDSCHSYALKRLPQHMLYCGLYVKVVALLSNGRLYQERIAAFGRDIATNLHVRDCIQLMQRIRRDPSIPREQRDQIADQHFQKVAKLITDNVDKSKESSALSLAKDLYSIGFGLAQNGKFVEALALYTQAQDLVPRGSSFAATVHYGLGSVNLILNDVGKATKSLMASIACMKILGEDGEGKKPRHSLYLGVSRLQAKALMAQCSYKIALSQFEDTLEQMKDDSFESKLEYGILMYWKARLHQLMGESSIACTELEKCIKWKENMRESSRNLAAAHGTLADIYASMGRTIDARKQVDSALKAIQDVDKKWPTLKYDDDDKESDLEVKLLTAKWRSLRPDLPKDWSSYESIIKQIKESPILLMDQSAHDLRCIARAYMAGDEHERAVSILEDALNLMAGRTDSLERALCLIDLGNSFMDQGESYDNEKKAKTMFELGLRLFELALNIQRPKLGDCQQVLETLDAIGNLHVHLRKHEIAISVYTDALALAKKLRSDNEKIAGILYFLGECHEELSEHEDAERRYKECLMGLRTDRPSDDLDIARPLQRLGAISLVDGKYKDAKQLYEEIRKIREANFDSGDVLLAETRDVLSFIDMKLQNYESACSHLTEALEIRMQLDSVRSIADTLYQIGMTYRMRSDHANALKNFEQGLASLDGSVRKDDALLVSIILAIGNTKINLGKTADAPRLCQRAMEVRASILGPDHRKTANASRSLGVANYLLNKLDDSSFYLHQYVRITEPHASQRKVNEYLIVLIMLSDIQEANGRHKLGRKILTTARDICNKDAAAEHSFPKIAQIVDDRFSGLTPKAQVREGQVYLEQDAEEIALFQSTVLTDD